MTPHVLAAQAQPRRSCAIIGLQIVLFAVYLFFSNWPSYIIFSPRDNVLLKESNGRSNEVDHAGSTRPKVLIAQYSAGQKNSHYSILLNLTEPINQLYAERWGYDFYVLRGPTPELMESLQSQGITNFPDSRSTYFKVLLLENAIKEKYFDILVILDADAIFYDFSRDIAQIIPQERLLVAHKVQRNDSDSTGNVNIGVTVWNLRHTRAQWLSETWKARCLQRIGQGRRDDDQSPLQDILRKELNPTERNNLVLAVSHDFAYGKGTFVKHFIRFDNSNWAEGFERRVGKIREVWKEVCPRYELQCPTIAMFNSNLTNGTVDSV